MRADGLVCTGFKVSINEYITAYHCVVDQEGNPLSNLELAFTSGESYLVDKFSRLDARSDLAYFSVLGNENLAKLDLVRSSEPYTKLSTYSADLSSSSVHLVTQKDCMVIGQDTESGLLLHNCDTVPGSSGSPILSNGKVVGVHLGATHLGSDEKAENVACSFSALDGVDVTKLSYEGEKCHCSVRCPGRCSPPSPVPPIPVPNPLPPQTIPNPVPGLDRHIGVCGRVFAVTVAVYATCFAALVALPPVCTAAPITPVCAQLVRTASEVCGIAYPTLKAAIGICLADASGIKITKED